MSAQVTAQTTGADERTILARASVSIMNLINERFEKSLARFTAALHESRRREAVRLLHHYRHLNNDLHN